MPRGGAAAASTPTTPGHEYRCWFPVGTPGGPRGARARNQAGRQPPSAVDADPQRERLMAGSGTAHLRARGRDAAAGRGPRRRVPGRAHGPEGPRGLRHQPRRAAGRDARPRRRVGCGKSTTGQAIMQLPPPDVGHGAASTATTSPQLDGRGAAPARARSMQMIFQDPISSLNPRRKVGDIVAEGLEIWKIGDDGDAAGPRSTRCSTPSASIPTPPRDRRPHEFSGGQCQRISIARARRHRPEADHLRRAGVGARRVGAGADPQPARGHEGSATGSR